MFIILCVVVVLLAVWLFRNGIETPKLSKKHPMYISGYNSGMREDLFKDEVVFYGC